MEEGVEVLGEQECLRLLRTASVGRVGITVGALPVILPVNYGVLDGAIVFRTAGGTKLRAAVRNAVVAFEVDAIDPAEHRGWSVLAVGTATELTNADDLAAAARLGLEPLVPAAGAHYVRLAPELVSGRRIG